MLEVSDRTCVYGEVFRQVTQCIRDSYLDRRFVEDDWPALTAQYSSRVAAISDDDGFRDLMDEFLGDNLKLSHVAFITPDRAAHIRERTGGDIPDVLSIKQRTTDRANYVKLPSFSLPAFSRERVARAFAQTTSNQTVIVDVRLNNGGAASALGETLGILVRPDARFLTVRTGTCPTGHRATVVYPIAERDNIGHDAEIALIERRQLTEWHTSLAPALTIDQPLVVIVGPRTYSCGELFAQVIKDTGRGTVLGVRTAGAAVASRDLDCGHGYVVTVPFASMITAAGVDLEGIGLTPDGPLNLDVADTEPLNDEQIQQVLDVVT